MNITAPTAIQSSAAEPADECVSTRAAMAIQFGIILAVMTLLVTAMWVNRPPYVQACQAPRNTPGVESGSSAAPDCLLVSAVPGIWN